AQPRLMARRQRTPRGLRAGGPDPELRDEPSRVAQHGPPVEEGTPPEPRRAIAGEQEVVGHAETRGDARAQAVLGHVADPPLANRARGGVGAVRAVDANGAPRGAAQP